MAIFTELLIQKSKQGEIRLNENNQVNVAFI